MALFLSVLLLSAVAKEVHMIIKKHWKKYHKTRALSRNCMGIFLFGFIPLYIRKSDWEKT